MARARASVQVGGRHIKRGSATIRRHIAVRLCPPGAPASLARHSSSQNTTQLQVRHGTGARGTRWRHQRQSCTAGEEEEEDEDEDDGEEDDEEEEEAIEEDPSRLCR
jgi:hypothetical protein